MSRFLKQKDIDDFNNEIDDNYEDEINYFFSYKKFLRIKVTKEAYDSLYYINGIKIRNYESFVKFVFETFEEYEEFKSDVLKSLNEQSEEVGLGGIVMSGEGVDKIEESIEQVGEDVMILKEEPEEEDEEFEDGLEINQWKR